MSKSDPYVKINCDGQGCEASVKVTVALGKDFRIYPLISQIYGHNWTIGHNPGEDSTHYCPDCKGGFEEGKDDKD